MIGERDKGDNWTIYSPSTQNSTVTNTFWYFSYQIHWPSLGWLPFHLAALDRVYHPQMDLPKTTSCYSRKPSWAPHYYLSELQVPWLTVQALGSPAFFVLSSLNTASCLRGTSFWVAAFHVFSFLPLPPHTPTLLLTSRLSPRFCLKGLISSRLTHQWLFLPLSSQNHSCDLAHHLSYCG